METSSTGMPLNPGVSGVPAEVAIAPEPPEIAARSLYVAGRLLAPRPSSSSATCSPTSTCAR
jgi:hypothetical protein